MKDDKKNNDHAKDVKKMMKQNTSVRSMLKQMTMTAEMAQETSQIGKDFEFSMVIPNEADINQFIADLNGYKNALE